MYNDEINRWKRHISWKDSHSISRRKMKNEPNNYKKKHLSWISAILKQNLYKRSSVAILFRMLLLGAILCVIMIGIVVYLAEYGSHRGAIGRCSWPSSSSSNDIIKALILADIHLVGSKGHWLDRMRRDFEMKRAFETCIMMHRPDVVVIVGDVFDEGQFCSKRDWQKYTTRFNDIFQQPLGDIPLLTTLGNHDVGFHYKMKHSKTKRFEEMFGTSMREEVVDGVTFVLVNSMALEGDTCRLCRDARQNLDKIKDHIKEEKRRASDKGECYTRPILVSHFPLYRKNEVECERHDVQDNLLAGIDEDPGYGKRLDISYTIPFNFENKEGNDVIGEEASLDLLQGVDPRMVFSAHTHYYCEVTHSFPSTNKWNNSPHQRTIRSNVKEVTVSSFNWRNRKDPSMLLATIYKKNCKYDNDNNNNDNNKNNAIHITATTNGYNGDVSILEKGESSSGVYYSVCYLVTEGEIIRLYVMWGSVMILIWIGALGIQMVLLLQSQQTSKDVYA